MITDINEILTEWAFRTKSGILNPKSMAHQILLDGILKNYGWPEEARAELLNNLNEIAPTAMVKNPNPKAKKDKVQYRYAQQWMDKNPGAETSDDFKNDVGGEEEKEDEIAFNSDSGDFIDNRKTLPDPKNKKEKIPNPGHGKPMDPETLDKDQAHKYGRPATENAVKKIEELRADGYDDDTKVWVNEKKRIKAKALAEKFIEQWKLNKGLYLQPSKDGKGKLYVGRKFGNRDISRGIWTNKKHSETTTMGDWVDMIESTGAHIPIRQLSSTIAGPQELHPDRIKAKVEVIHRCSVDQNKNRDEKSCTAAGGKWGVAGRQITMASRGKTKKRTFILRVDPNDPLAEMRMNMLPTGSVQFCDINDASTSEGRAHCIHNAANNIDDMLGKLDEELRAEDPNDVFHQKLIAKVKKKLRKLKSLAASNDHEAFDKLCDEVLAETKRKNPVFFKGKRKKKLNPKTGRDEVVYKKNAFTSMTSYLAETLEAMRFLNKGYETYIPSSGNFTTADVLPLHKSAPRPVKVTTEGGKATPEETDIDEMDVVMDSVKAGAGAAAGMVGKIEGSTFKNKKTTVKIGTKDRVGTKEILGGLVEQYNIFYPEPKSKKDTKPPVPLTPKQLKHLKADNDSAFDAIFTGCDPDEVDKLKKAVFEESKKRAATQYDRQGGHPTGALAKRVAAAGEDRDAAIRRGQMYHYNQWMVTMIHNHPTEGLESQAFANSDHHYKVKPGSGGEEFDIERKHTTGENGDVVYASWEPDQSYTVNLKTGRVAPQNRLSSRFKHDNPVTNPKNPFNLARCFLQKAKKK
jgi:hypothetical protein